MNLLLFIWIVSETSLGCYGQSPITSFWDRNYGFNTSIKYINMQKIQDFLIIYWKLNNKFKKMYIKNTHSIINIVDNVK